MKTIQQKMKTKQPKLGFSIHCHHDIMVEWCFDYDERVKAIKNKPVHEVATRLRLFKILPEKALEEIPLGFRKAYAERKKAYAKWEKADAEWEKAYAEWGKAYAKWEKADAEWEKADAEWEKADAKWEKADKNAFHRKWCGCKEWDEKEMKLIFAGEPHR